MLLSSQRVLSHMGILKVFFTALLLCCFAYSVISILDKRMNEQFVNNDIQEPFFGTPILISLFIHAFVVHIHQNHIDKSAVCVL